MAGATFSTVKSDSSSAIPSISSFDWTGKEKSSQNLSVCFQQQTAYQLMIPCLTNIWRHMCKPRKHTKKSRAYVLKFNERKLNSQHSIHSARQKEMRKDFNYVTWLSSKWTDQPVNLCFCFPGCAPVCVWAKIVLLTLFRFLLNRRRLLRQVLLLLSLQCIPRCLFLFFWWGDILTRGHRSASHNFWRQTDIFLFRVWVVVRLQRKTRSCR